MYKRQGERTLDDLLPEVFALVREASRRVMGMRHYDVQLVGGIVLHRGKIAEMKTGEGKTLVATLPVALNALSGKGVHVVTVNDYLASRDAQWMGKLYNFLGLSVGVIVNGLDDQARKEAYGADITYGTNNEFGFDYLRDNMKFYATQLVQRGHNYAIVDEVDSILIDEARTPLIISGASDESVGMYLSLIHIFVRLWVSSVEYREDIRISDQILGRLVDAYRRIRNTCRFILGTINDLTRADLLPLDQLLPLDRYALHAAAQVHDRVQDAYMTYDFHKVYHSLHNYCVTDLSAVYLDILKDRLYSSAPAATERRSAQTALYHLLCLLVRDMAPVLSFTAEEIFHHLPNDLRDDVPTVFALPPVDSRPYLLEDGVRDDWNVLLAVRGAVTRAIEPLRRDSVVGHSLDTSVTLYVADELRERLEGLHTDLRAFFIVSQLHLAPLAAAPADAVQDLSLIHI